MKPSLIIGILFVSAGVVLGQTTTTYTKNDGRDIPDGNPIGMTSTTNLTGFAADAYITALTVTLDITGGWNGDLYAYLSGPNGGFAVLLNRTGVNDSDQFGYSDAGFNITLDDNAANGNIHYYQDVSNPNGGVLGGTWQPDGENVGPTSDSVGSTTPSAFLSSFYNTNPNGTWTLYVADLSAGSTSTLVSWGMSVTVVPEPQTWAFVGLGLAAFAVAGKWKRK